MKQIHTAIASYGMSGQVFHGPLLKVNEGFKVVQVLERSKNNSAGLFPEAEIVRTYNEILENPEVELVVVNTPDHLHFEMAKQALEAGKHVVIEKPITQKVDEAEELCALAKEKNKVLSVFQNRRWDCDFRTVKQVIAQGKLGRLVEFESHFDRYRTEIAQNTWKEEGNEYVGVLFNLGSHMIDQAYSLFGMPEYVTAHLRIVRSGGKVNDYYDIRLSYPNFSAILKCSYLVKDAGPRYIIHGEKGSFQKFGIDPQEELLKQGELPEGDNWGTEPAEEWGALVYDKNEEEVAELIESVPGDYRIYYNNIFDAIRNNQELLVQSEETVDVLRILDACLQSNREKRSIKM